MSILCFNCGCQENETPTALEQVAVERVWDVEPFSIAKHGGYNEFVDVVWNGPRDGERPRPGVLFGSIWKDGLKGSAVRGLPKSIIPANEDYAGAAPPYAVYRVVDESRIEVDTETAWDWEDGDFMPMFALGGTLEHRKKMAELHDYTVRPDWWPTEGAASEAVYDSKRTVPERNAIVYYFNHKRPRQPGEPGGTSGPIEYIIEDHQTGTPRRIGFRLGGERGPPPMGLLMAFDGLWGLALDHATMRVWLLPLHLAWDYLDDEQVDAGTESTDTNDNPEDRAP